jgi:hypothetical protein
MSKVARVRQRGRSKSVTRSAWSRHVEQATIAAGADIMREAKTAYSGIADPALQMRLAYEIAETRGPELCLAYKNVVMVAAGYKTKRTAKGRTRIVKTPSVTFVVRRKWRGDGPARQSRQKLPTHLLAYTELDGERVLCAVPTDVVVEHGFSRATPQGPSGIVADRVEVGNATCAAVIRVAGRRDVVMLCCQHVLTPDIPLNKPQPVAGTQIALLNDLSIPLALTSANGGQIRSDGSPSFDVQLTQPPDANALRAALDGLALAPGHEHVPDKSTFDAIANFAQFAILVSPNNIPLGRVALPAAFLRYVPNVQGIPYRFIDASGSPQDRPVHHRLLIMFRLLGRSTAGGDSGSPIVMRAPGGRFTLVGMHIAGGFENGFAYSYAIPAWLLFNPAQYSRLPSGATLTPLAV